MTLRKLRNRFIIFSFCLTSFFKKILYFFYLAFRRKSIEFYRQINNTCYMNSYYGSTVFKKFGRNLIYSGGLANATDATSNLCKTKSSHILIHLLIMLFRGFDSNFVCWTWNFCSSETATFEKNLQNMFASFFESK